MLWTQQVKSSSSWDGSSLCWKTFPAHSCAAVFSSVRQTNIWFLTVLFCRRRRLTRTSLKTWCWWNSDRSRCRRLPKTNRRRCKTSDLQRTSSVSARSDCRQRSDTAALLDLRKLYSAAFRWSSCIYAKKALIFPSQPIIHRWLSSTFAYRQIIFQFQIIKLKSLFHPWMKVY